MSKGTPEITRNCTKISTEKLTILERPKPQTLYHKEHVGDVRGRPTEPQLRQKSTKRHPRCQKTMQTNLTKKGINMIANVMHQKRPGKTPSKHEKSCWRLHGSTICTCCTAQEKTRKLMLFCATRQCQKTTKTTETTWRIQKVSDWAPRTR